MTWSFSTVLGGERLKMEMQLHYTRPKRIAFMILFMWFHITGVSMHCVKCCKNARKPKEVTSTGVYLKHKGNKDNNITSKAHQNGLQSAKGSKRRRDVPCNCSMCLWVIQVCFDVPLLPLLPLCFR